ncbi:protein Ycf2-like, partial [Haliotis rufescens]|uniref:protein Ycf2-like n=1 Tax=Haliotis rufescens TaxID=6454 RepID=UPI00201F7170
SNSNDIRISDVHEKVSGPGLNSGLRHKHMQSLSTSLSNSLSSSLSTSLSNSLSNSLSSSFST